MIFDWLPEQGGRANLSTCRGSESYEGGEPKHSDSVAVAKVVPDET